MFTGIVETTGRLRSIRKTAKGIRMEIDRPWAIEPGASVAVNGVCLTALEGKELAFDVVPETLSRTTLGSLKPGVRVNLERALRAGARLDGHIVQGHVDGKGRVRRLSRASRGVTLEIEMAPALESQIVAKGSIAVDGVSLTVVDVEDGAFSVALIPTTLRRTTLGLRKAGDAVNLETDVLLKRKPRRSGVTMDLLKRAGFV